MLDLHVESFHDEAYEKREHVMSSSFGLKHLELSLSLRPLVVENEGAEAVSAVAMALDFYCHGFCSVSSKERTRGHHCLFFAAQFWKRIYILYIFVLFLLRVLDTKGGPGLKNLTLELYNYLLKM